MVTYTDMNHNASLHVKIFFWARGMNLMNVVFVRCLLHTKLFCDKLSDRNIGNDGKRCWQLANGVVVPHFVILMDISESVGVDDWPFEFPINLLTGELRFCFMNSVTFVIISFQG